MTIEVKHPTPPDGTFSVDGAAAWQEVHALTQAGERLLGKATAGAGATEEMTGAQVLAFAGAEASGAAAAAVSAHEAAADPHAQYALESAIGAVLGGTDGSVLFISGGVVAQDNTNFKWGTTAGQGLTANAGIATTDVGFRYTQTWNNAAIPFTAYKYVVDDQNSAVGSLHSRWLGGAGGTTPFMTLNRTADLTVAGTVTGQNAVVGSNYVLSGSLIYVRSNTGTIHFGTGDDANITRTLPGTLSIGTGAVGSFAGSLKLTSLLVAGSASGVATISAPAAAGTPTLTLPTASGNIVAATGTPDGTKYLRDDSTWQPVTATPPDIAVSLLAPAVDETIAAGYSAVLVRKFTIASGKKLTLGSGSRMRIL
jgi:hypothetical protein